MAPPLSSRILKTSFSQNSPQPLVKKKQGLFDIPSFKSHNCAKKISRSRSTKKKQQSTHRLGTPSSLENSALLKIIFSPHRPISLPQKFITKISPLRQQCSNSNTGQQTKPRYLVPPDFFQPCGYNMDQSDKCRFFLHLAWPHQQTNHKTLDPLSKYCPGPPPSTIPKHPINQTNLGPSPATHPPSKNQQCICIFQPTNTIFSDQTGAFPIISRREYLYIMFIYVYNINTILMRCLKTKAGAEHLQTFKDVPNLFLLRGLQPKYYRMDNECSAPIKNSSQRKKWNYNLPPRKCTEENGLNGPSRLANPTSYLAQQVSTLNSHSTYGAD